MSGPVYWISEAGRLEESDGTFFLTLKSGDETRRFAMPPSAAMQLFDTGHRLVTAWEREAATSEPVSLSERRARPSKCKGKPE